MITIATQVQNLTQIILVNAPIDNTNENQLDFTDVNQQRDYFNGRRRHAFSNLTYQRKDNSIDLPISVDSLWGVNYVMYQNANFGQKWFYAFIDKMEYVSSDVARIFISTDAWQTWLFDITIGNSYIERQHVNAASSISIEEGLDYGNAYVKRKQAHLFTRSANVYIIACKQDMVTVTSNGVVPNPSFPLDDIPQAVHYYICRNTTEMTNFFKYLTKPVKQEDAAIISRGRPQWSAPFTNDTPQDWIKDDEFVSNLLKSFLFDTASYLVNTYQYDSAYDNLAYMKARLVENILNITRLPFMPDVRIWTQYVGDPEVEVYKITGGTAGIVDSANCGFNNEWSSEPKLNYYPYTFFKITDHKGQEKVIKPEYNSSPTLQRIAAFGNPVKVRYYPTNMSYGADKDLSIVAETNTTIPVTNDAYGSYLVGNANQNTANLLSGGVNAYLNGVGSGFSGGVVSGLTSLIGAVPGTALSVASSIYGLNAKKQDIKMAAPAVTGQSGNPFFEDYDSEDGVWVELWTINDVHNNVLSDFFKRYGYAYNRNGIPGYKPNSIGRKYVYIKTQDCFATGGVPMEDMDTIKTMFNKGVTIWGSPWNVGVYE